MGSHGFEWPRLAAELEQLLRLRAVPFGMKLFESREAMEAVPKIRRPKAVHTLDQVVAQAARLGWTVGVTATVHGTDERVTPAPSPSISQPPPGPPLPP